MKNKKIIILLALCLIICTIVGIIYKGAILDILPKKEETYKLLLQGLFVTVIITIFSMLFGTLLGGIICAFRRSVQKIFNIPAKLFIALIQGIPILVLLLILYYIIFASFQLNSVVIAIIAFSINFSAYSSEIFRTGLDTIEKGQLEAAKAAGFNKWQIFKLIFVPQFLQHILPAYRNLAIDMLKATSIVGYIAIQDLTKMSDLVRSQSYEAFSPIILTAVIYFALAYLLARLLLWYESQLNPQYRKRIVKGVEVKNYVHN